MVLPVRWINSLIWDRIAPLPTRSGEPDFDRMLAIVVRIAVLSLTGLIYAATLFRYVTSSTTIYKLALFAAVVTIIPPGVALASRALCRVTREVGAIALQGTELLVSAATVLFVCAAALIYVFRLDMSLWSTIVDGMLLVLAGAHLTLLVTLYINPNKSGTIILPVWRKVITNDGNLLRDVALVCYFLVAMLLLFRVEPTNYLINVVFSGVRDLSPRPRLGVLIASPVAAAIVILTCFRLVHFEMTWAAQNPVQLHRLQRIALVACVVLIFPLYFDFTFRSDVLHFLTNVGPAAQIIHAGAVPMITAFSQYGPGPLLTTWLTFLMSLPSFHAANVISQLCSLTLYAVTMICLYRMTRYRLTALLLGFVSIGILLAGWWGGNGSLNTIPSSMGMRYLPNALLVLSISFLRPGRAVSLSVFASMVLSALWSYETLAGSTFVFGLFILILALRDRDLFELLRRGIAGFILPVVVSVALMSAMTLVWTGEWPRYPAYLAFLLAYSPVSDFWALSGNGSFFGWILVAIAGMTALALSLSAALGSPTEVELWDPKILIYRFAPMAALTAFMSSYFVGRSVDFTLIISFMPMATLIIPAILTVFRAALQGNSSARFLAPIACLAIFLPLTFSIAAMYRAGSPYALPAQVCLQERICSPAALLELARKRYQLRPMLDQPADPNFFEQNGIASDAISLIDEYASDRKKIALFLGIHPATIWSIHTNTVLVLMNKGHRWPISYILSDEVNPVLRRSIIETDVNLEEGEPVFIRNDESRLGELEAAIVNGIRAGVRLCPMAEKKTVSAYRATRRPSC